jgi:hypothetical protein
MRDNKLTCAGFAIVLIRLVKYSSSIARYEEK